MILNGRERSLNVRINLRILLLAQEVRLVDRCQRLPWHHGLVNLQLVRGHGLEGRVSLRSMGETSDLLWILIQMNEILIILKFFDTLLELDLVRVLRNLFVFRHQIVLKLAFHKELQGLDQVLIQFFLFLLLPCHLGGNLGRSLFLLLLILLFVGSLVRRWLVFVGLLLVAALFVFLFSCLSLGQSWNQELSFELFEPVLDL